MSTLPPPPPFPPSSNNPVLVTNLLTSRGILLSTSPIFVLRAVLVTKLLGSGIFLSTSFIFLLKPCLSTLYFDFQLHFQLYHSFLYKSIGTFSTYQHLNYLL